MQDEDIRYDTFNPGKKLTVNVNGEVSYTYNGTYTHMNVLGQDLQKRDGLPGQPPQV